MCYYQKNDLKPIKEKLEPMDLLNFSRPAPINQSLNTELVMGRTINIMPDSEDKEQSSMHIQNLSINSFHVDKNMTG